VGKKVFVTGASGHIGYNVARKLLERDYDVHLLSRSENYNIAQLIKSGATLHFCNLHQPSSYASLLTGADAIFHLAAENTTNTSDEQFVIDNTFGLTKTFLDTVTKQKVPVIIYTSSVVVFGRSSDPAVLLNENNRALKHESPYVKGKALAEDYCEELVKNNGTDIRRIYPSWVVGQGDARLTPPHKIIRDYLTNGMLFYFRGGVSIASVENVAQAHIDAYEKGSMGGKYVTAGENISFQTLYKILAKHSGGKEPLFCMPKWIIVAGAIATKAILRMIGMPPIIDPGYARAVFGNFSWYDSTTAIKELGYKTGSAEEILSSAIPDVRKKILKTTFLGLKRTDTIPPEHKEVGKLLITGVPGWLGNRMADIMINGDRSGNWQSSRKVRLLVQPHLKGMLDLPEQFEIVYGDITDSNAVKTALEGVSTVFHLAGAIYPPKIKTLYKVNYEGTKCLVDACIDKKVRRIIFMSTDSTVGKGTKSKRIFDENTPPSPNKNYGKSKYMAEKYILDKSREGLIDGTALRGFWFFGPFAPDRQLAFFNMFSWKRQPVFGNGKNYRSISHVDDIVQAFFKAENQKVTFGKWYWIAAEKADVTVNDINRIAAKVFNTQYKPLYIPVWMCRCFGLADTILGKFGMLQSTIHAAGKFYFDIAGDISAAKRDFDYQPTIDMEEAIREVKGMM
jgi:dihydroflavonol-4-reductase